MEKKSSEMSIITHSRIIASALASVSDEASEHEIGHGVQIIVNAFLQYFRHDFREIAVQAKRRFETRDWKGAIEDGKKRIELYSKALDGTVARLREKVGSHIENEIFWEEMRQQYTDRVDERYDADLAMTFFYSVMRRIMYPLGKSVEYADDGITEKSHTGKPAPVRAHRKKGRISTWKIIRGILTEADFSVPFQDIDKSSKKVAVRITSELRKKFGDAHFSRIEVLEPVFYRNKGAYIVGRIIKGRKSIPLILALVHPEEGIKVDAVLMDERDARIVFSYTRSNFHVDVSAYRELIQFLHEIMPGKNLPGIYSSIGFIHPAKVALVHMLRNHILKTGERFDFTRGQKGWVMATFTLPSFPYVFKIVVDKTEKEGIPNRQCAASRSPDRSLSRTLAQDASLTTSTFTPSLAYMPSSAAMATDEQSVRGMKPMRISFPLAAAFAGSVPGPTVG